MAESQCMEHMPPMSAEPTVSRNYLDWLLAVPWKKKSKEIRELPFAQQVLESDHYGLEKIKDRILEFLAVRRLVKDPKGSILCFVRPPGVGETSPAISIPQAPGRQFVPPPLGQDLLSAFGVVVCGCSAHWAATHFLEGAFTSVRDTVCDVGVVCGVSGGIDSCCVAALVHRAVGDRLTCIFVDHGLLRLGEGEARGGGEAALGHTTGAWLVCVAREVVQDTRGGPGRGGSRVEGVEGGTGDVHLLVSSGVQCTREDGAPYLAHEVLSGRVTEAF